MAPDTTSNVDDRVHQWLSRKGLSPDTRTQLLVGDASARRYVRVTPSSNASIILLVHSASFDPETDSFLDVGALFARMGIPVPSVDGCEADLGIVALEDLGDVTLEDHVQALSVSQRRDRYREAVDLIARIQEEGARLQSGGRGPFGMSFDIDKLTWELDFFVEHFLTRHRGVTLTSAWRIEAAVEFNRLASSIAGEPRVLCHRDFHSRNLMWHRRKLYVIDFQDARLGPCTYDLVSLLRDCYVTVDEDIVGDLVDQFRTTATRDDEPTFSERFDVMSLQRHLKALGTFGYQGATGNHRYDDAIPRTLGYLRQVFGRRPQFAAWRRLLASVIPELE